jgi:hypothetical protein
MSKLAGLAWYTVQDYPRILKIMADAHLFPCTYGEWRIGAEQREREAQDRGFVLVRAMIDPDEFLAWCKERGIQADLRARGAFAAEYAMATVKDEQ